MDPVIVAAILFIAFFAYLAWRRRSPQPFPPWLTPLLHSPLRRRGFSPEAAAQRHGIAPGMAVLEVGPGDGYLTIAAIDRTTPGGRIICLDVQLPMLRKLRKALGSATPPLVCASGSQLPFRARAFDLVFLAHVIGEIPDRTGALAEYARVLRSSGTLALTEGLPDPDFIRCPHLVDMASAAGFRPAEHFGRALHYTQRFEFEEPAA